MQQLLEAQLSQCEGLVLGVRNGHMAGQHLRSTSRDVVGFQTLNS
jgi:hypothetical protein